MILPEFARTLLPMLNQTATPVKAVHRKGPGPAGQVTHEGAASAAAAALSLADPGGDGPRAGRR